MVDRFYLVSEFVPIPPEADLHLLVAAKDPYQPDVFLIPDSIINIINSCKFWNNIYLCNKSAFSKIPNFVCCGSR